MEERLHKLSRLVDAGSFTAAAKVMHLSQPALSAAIKKLERELGVSLLARPARPLRLTAAGSAAYTTAKEQAISKSNLKLRLAELARQPVPVTIGMTDGLAEALFLQTAGVTQLDEHTELSLVVNNSRYLAEATARGDIDMAFIVEQNRPLLKPLATVAVGAEPLVIVAHIDRYAAIKAAAGRGALPEFVSYDQHSTTYQVVAETLAKHNLTVQPVFYSTSPSVMLAAVVARQGVAVLPYLMVREGIERGILKAMRIGRLAVVERPIIVIRRQDRQLPATVLGIAGQVSAVLKQLMVEAAG